VIQFTPPGSEASIIFGKGITTAQPGSIDRLVPAVYDIDAARAELRSHGVEVSLVFHDAGGGSPAAFTKAPRRALRVRTPKAVPTPPTPRSAIPMATSGCSRRSGSGSPGRTTQEPLDGKMTDILLTALQGAAGAHGAHEKELGRPDPDRPQWCAEHMRACWAARDSTSPDLQPDLYPAARKTSGAARLQVADVPFDIKWPTGKAGTRKGEEAMIVG
jgi:hypothetical protein